MRQFFRRLAAVSVLCGAGLAQAAPVTIDFEAVPVGTTGPISVDGFVFETTVPGWIPQIVTDTVGNRSLELSVSGSCFVSVGCADIFVEFSQEDGLPFTLLGGDFNGITGSGSEPEPILVLGFALDGEWVLNPISLIDGPLLNKVRISFSSSFPVSTGGFELLTLSIDNVQVNVVPVPAAAWLFASGLGLLGWLRRRPA